MSIGPPVKILLSFVYFFSRLSLFGSIVSTEIETIDNYLKTFQWNTMKYRTDKSLVELAEILNTVRKNDLPYGQSILHHTRCHGKRAFLPLSRSLDIAGTLDRPLPPPPLLLTDHKRVIIFLDNFIGGCVNRYPDEEQDGQLQCRQGQLARNPET